MAFYISYKGWIEALEHNKMSWKVKDENEMYIVTLTDEKGREHVSKIPKIKIVVTGHFIQMHPEYADTLKEKKALIEAIKEYFRKYPFQMPNQVDHYII